MDAIIFVLEKSVAQQLPLWRRGGVSVVRGYLARISLRESILSHYNGRRGSKGGN